MPQSKPPAKVIRIDFVDTGQDCIAWYVRNRSIIDCEPCVPRTWVGIHVIGTPEAGKCPRILNRERQYIEYPCEIAAVTELPTEEAEKAIERWKDFMLEELGSDDE